MFSLAMMINLLYFLFFGNKIFDNRHRVAFFKFLDSFNRFPFFITLLASPHSPIIFYIILLVHLKDHRGNSIELAIALYGLYFRAID
jgi:hypothetical protein